jgi:DNA invertase Pin-like site-specific DNA recombinase
VQQTSPPALKAGRAAMYVRMSTEHQQYSTENQSYAIERYATWKNLVIVKRFIDYGKSGLTLTHRAALRELLQEVQSGAAEFGTILVYDVSRWGRFQDADESAYYEYSCKRAHVRVHYCAEPFENDGSIYSTLVKTIKRSMAGEYSRELSVKVFAGQARLVELGYRQGGPAGFGLRRQLVGSNGQIKSVLKHGERKSIQSDRVVLIPGPQRELAIVREIFSMFTVDRRPERQIADFLNKRGVRSESGRPWSRYSVHAILINPKYMGSNVFNRRSSKLHQTSTKNPVDAWIRRDGAYKAIVPVVQYIQAQKIVQARCNHLSDQQMLEHLRWLLKRAGKLTAKVINQDIATPCVACVQRRFTSLTRAYSLIGYKPSRNYKGIGRTPKTLVQEQSPPKRGPATAEGRARIAEAQRKRWRVIDKDIT